VCAKAHGFGESLEPHLPLPSYKTYRCATRPDAEAQPYNTVSRQCLIAFEAVDRQDALDPDEQAMCKASGAASDMDNCHGGAEVRIKLP